MVDFQSDTDRTRMREELGFQRWEAIGHFLSDGDYLGFNRSDFRGAIAEYEKAWALLYTPWQRKTGGADILEGIADFALKSGDNELAQETLGTLLPRSAAIAKPSLDEARERLAQQANQQQSD